MKKIFLSGGSVCPRRSMDIMKLETYFLINDCNITEKPEDANYLVYLSCAFIEPFIKQALKNIEILSSFSGELIVCGCLPLIYKKEFDKTYKGKYFTTLTMEKIDSFFPDFQVKFDAIADSNCLHYNHLYHSFLDDEMIRRQKIDTKKQIIVYEGNFFIRIADGCNANCSYCSHKIAIGPFKSKSTEECKTEFQKGYEEGNRLFTLTAMDTGPYGIDIGTTLPQLLESLISIHDDASFIIDDMNTSWLIKYENEIAAFCNRKKIKKIMTCIQSGNARVLKLMNRYSNTEKLKLVILRLKEADPEMLFVTEIIIGVPTETDEEFDETLEFVKNAQVDFLYLYPYFENENMKTYTMYPKCSRDTIERRMDKAVSFFERHSINYVTFPIYQTETVAEITC